MEREITKRLVEWKNNPSKLPLVVYGARQVGKTYSILDFAKKHYRNHIYANLDTDNRIGSIFEGDLDVERIILELEIYFDEEICEGKTLIFFDEVQSNPIVLKSLKYFAEHQKQYDVIVAGSLLGVAVHRQKEAFPVGKVDAIQLKPLSFEEFLWSQNQKLLANEISKHTVSLTKISPALHSKAISLFTQYLIVGGLPASINAFMGLGGRSSLGSAELNPTKTFLASKKVLRQIINGYLSDMSKYTSGAAESLKIRMAYDSIPEQLAKENKKFQYSKVKKGGNADKFAAAIDWLEGAGLIIKSRKVSTPEIPLKAYQDESYFKLYLHDVGVLTSLSEVPEISIMHFDSVDNTYFGAIAENYVAICLYNLDLPVRYWRSQKNAEIDFLLQIEDKVLPLEVKKGSNTRSKSLGVYQRMYQPNEAVGMSLKNFGCTDDIISVPLYAAEFFLKNVLLP
jgi:predicted AAA+ superfamily ATPase